jgi:hypothetical protein
MPYIVRPNRFPRSARLLGGVVAASGALMMFGSGAAFAAPGPPAPPAPPTIPVAPTPPAPPKPPAGPAAEAAQEAAELATQLASCQAAELFHPFASFGDNNLYMLAPGQTATTFNGAGWTLSGGASVQNATLPSGGTGPVLNLPSGSEAVSPTMCVNREYPVARMQVRDVVGAEGVQFNVSYEGKPNWKKPQNTGQVHGNGTEWTLSNTVNTQPFNENGWQLLKITLIPGGKTSDFQVDNFYIDPYAR